jgi:molecular chaperone GrpE
MSLDAQKQQLLLEFQDYLANADDVSELNPDDQPDLALLFGEMAALTGEVKTEARHFKSTLDSLAEALDTVQADNHALAAALAAGVERAAQERDELLRVLLLEMVDIYDRFDAGFGVLQRYRPVNSLFNHSKKKDVRFIKGFRKGQELALKRFEQHLLRHQVYPIVCVGKPFDPYTMNTLEIGRDPKQDNGIVLEELRKGFLVGNHVLRLAEVKVNKL